MFALDANAIIHAFKGHGRVRDRIVTRSPAELCIPAIVLYEIEFGTLQSRNPKQRRQDLERLVRVLQILPFDGNAAQRAAEIRSDLAKAGKSIGPLDTLIAGTVLASGAVLVTNNTNEFSRIPGLRLEDWT